MRKKKDEQPGQKRRGGFGLIVFLLSVLLLLGAGAAAGGYFYAQHRLTAPGPVTADGADRVVYIARGASVTAMSAALKQAGAVQNPMHFRLAAKALKSETRLKAGEFAVPSGASLKDIVNILVEGKTILHPVTVPEGLTSAMIMRRIAAESVLVGDMPEVTPAEGVLLPDTYMVERGETRENVIMRMITARERLLEELWPQRQANLPLDTPEEAIILASIVEKETGLAEERPRVAAVFVNRLNRRMRLESDPTIIYGISQGEPLGRGLRRSEIDRKTDYNTYQIDRLPPTPICNPGRDAIAAVLNPPATKDVFFVADGSGGHAFATTYAQHLRNVANWRRVEKSGAP